MCTRKGESITATPAATPARKDTVIIATHVPHRRTAIVLARVLGAEQMTGLFVQHHVVAAPVVGVRRV